MQKCFNTLCESRNAWHNHSRSFVTGKKNCVCCDRSNRMATQSFALDCRRWSGDSVLWRGKSSQSYSSCGDLHYCHRRLYLMRHLNVCVLLFYMSISFDDELRFTPGVHQWMRMRTAMWIGSWCRYIRFALFFFDSFSFYSFAFVSVYLLLFIWFYHVSHESAMMCCLSNNRACLFHRWSQL